MANKVKIKRRMIRAGIEAKVSLTINLTIDKKGISKSAILTFSIFSSELSSPLDICLNL
tara:strand:- start:1 stop:177 length:177 start_codon:yes stop_codon:yes gene_type:complete